MCRLASSSAADTGATAAGGFAVSPAVAAPQPTPREPEPPAQPLAPQAACVVSALDVQLHIAAFHLELGNVLLHQQLDQFFDFFLIHRIPFGRMITGPSLEHSARFGRTTPTMLLFRSSSFVTGVSTSHPFSVTTTMSSMRMPPLPGHVNSRLNRDHHARRQPFRPACLPSRGGS